MTRKYKALGLALMAAVAAFALSGIAASSAVAAPEFTCIETPANVHAHCILDGKEDPNEQLNFTAGEGFGSIHCTEATFTGGTLATGTGTTIENVHPEYGGCTDSFGRAVDTTTTGCNFTFHVETKLETNVYHGKADLVCEAGKQIEIKVTSGGSVICTDTIGSQNGVGPVTYRNMTEASPTDVTVTSDARNIKNITSGGFFNCGIPNGEHTEGTTGGNVTVIARDTVGNQIDAEVSG
jgi:hypothetical protein